MDADRFDALIRTFYSRRRVLQTLTVLGAGLGFAGAAEAAPKQPAGRTKTTPK